MSERERERERELYLCHLILFDLDHLLLFSPVVIVQTKHLFQEHERMRGFDITQQLLLTFLGMCLELLSVQLGQTANAGFPLSGCQLPPFGSSWTASRFKG